MIAHISQLDEPTRAEYIERLTSVPRTDPARSRRVPLAFDAARRTFITAEQVRQMVADGEKLPELTCRGCGERLSLKRNARGSCWFSHGPGRGGGSCIRHAEMTPLHFAVQDAFTRLGDRYQKEYPLRYHADRPVMFIDVFDKQQGLAIEVACSKGDYVTKSKRLDDAGVPQMWLINADMPGYATKYGDEVLDLTRLAAGEVVLRGLFNTNGIDFVRAIGFERAFAVYSFLPWECIGQDEWRLIAVDHPLNDVFSGDGGVIHQMVMMNREDQEARVKLMKQSPTGRHKTWFETAAHIRPRKWPTEWVRRREEFIYDLEKLSRELREANEAAEAKRARKPKSKATDDVTDDDFDDDDDDFKETVDLSAIKFGNIQRLKATASAIVKRAAEERLEPDVELPLTTKAVATDAAPDGVEVAVVDRQAERLQPHEVARVAGCNNVALAAAAKSQAEDEARRKKWVEFERGAYSKKVEAVEAVVASASWDDPEHFDRLRIEFLVGKVRFRDGIFRPNPRLSELCRACGVDKSDLASLPQQLIGKRIVADHANVGTCRDFYGLVNFRPQEVADES